MAINKYVVDDEESHIELNKEECARCKSRPCLFVCPAGVYSLKGEEVVFDAAGCLECGTCRVVCPRGIVWRYPRESFGVIYRYG